jgi:hypothetical protein
VLKRAITHAQARYKVKRNVVLLCEVPQGCEGGQAVHVADAAARHTTSHASLPARPTRQDRGKNIPRQPAARPSALPGWAAVSFPAAWTRPC